MSALRHVALALSLLLCRAAWAAASIEAWTYYPAPPFLTDQATNAGLTTDLVNYLNKALAGKYEIRLVLLPRARLNMMLEAGDKAFVLFVPSAIFGGPNGGTYLWTSPLLADRQELVSRSKKPFEFAGPDSLVGIRFGSMQGHVYPVLAKEMESGKIRSDRATNEGSLISMLMAQHVDVITLPDSAIRYFTSVNPELKKGLSVSKQNLGEYTRHLMFQRGMNKERDDFEQVVRKMGTDPEWRAVLQKYGLDPGRRAVK